MKFRRLLSSIPFIIIIFTSLGVAQTPRTIRWSESDPNSRRVERKDGVVKELEITDGFKIEVSLREYLDMYLVELVIHNQSQKNLELKPADFQLQATRPQTKYLQYLYPNEAARKVITSAESNALSVESSGAMATKTETKLVNKIVVEHVPVIKTEPNPAAATDPSQPATITTTTIEVVHKNVTETITETVPDEAARSRARTAASQIRQEGGAESKRILRIALKGGSLSPQVKISGSSFYNRARGVQEFLIQVPLGEFIFEIPFKVVKKGFFRKTVIE